MFTIYGVDFYLSPKSVLRVSNSPVLVGNQVPKPIGQGHMGMLVRQGPRSVRGDSETQHGSTQRESNPHFRHGKAVGYRYIMGAKMSFNCQRSKGVPAIASHSQSHHEGADSTRVAIGGTPVSPKARSPGGNRTHVPALRKRYPGR